MKLIRKDIRKEVRADGTEYYFVQFVYESRNIIKHLFSKNEEQCNEKIVEDEIVFYNLNRAKEYANLVDWPSEDGWERAITSTRIVETTNKDIPNFSLNNNMHFSIRFIHPWLEDYIDKNRTSDLYYNGNIQYMYYFYTEIISGYVIMKGAKWKFFEDEYSDKNKYVEDFLCGKDYETAVFFENKSGKIIYASSAFYYNKFFETPYDLLKKVVGCNYKTREQIIEDANLKAINDRKHATVVSNEIIKIDSNLANGLNDLEDIVEDALLEKRNKLIADELKRIDEYKETLKKLIR